MAGTSRIDELRKKFDENPRRYFAPLANEYRKIGDFEQAIFICQEFLPQQPGHMSGHIVYGQALFETGRHDEARSVFETALALDPENLIALRHLGDIARARGDNETARAWYRRVLESDPRNEEIAGILASLDTDSSATHPAQALQPPAVPAAEASSGAVTTQSAIASASPASEARAGTAPDPIVSEPLTSAPSEGSFDDIAKLFTSASPSSGSSPSGPLELVHEGEDLLGHPDEHRSQEAQPIRTSGSSAPSGSSAFASEDNAPSGFQSAFLDGLTSPETAVPPAPPVKEAPASPAASADASTPFVTETMAELYVQQGHLEQALDVYRKLMKLHPNDAALAERLRALEADRVRQVHGVPIVPPREAEAVADAGPTIREFLGLIAEFRPRIGRAPDDTASNSAREAPRSAPPPERRASATGSVGSSLHSLFAQAEQGAPANKADEGHHEAKAAAPHDRGEQEPSSLRGRPATPAANELSLDHVFRHATPATGSGGQSGFSFDQFFSQQAHHDVAAADAEPSPEATAGQSDDIQQFNAWLEGLKKT